MNKISNGINKESDGLQVFQKQKFTGNLKNHFSKNFMKIPRKTSCVETFLVKNNKSSTDTFLRFFSKFLE